MYIVRKPDLLRMYRTAKSTDDFVITAPQIARGQAMVIENVSVANLDSANKAIAIGFKHETDDVWLESATLGSATKYSRYQGPITLRSDDRMMVKIFSPTLGDRIVVNITAYWQCVLTGV
jgi:hypothetical protein